MRSNLKAWIRENLFAEDPEEYIASLLKKDSPILQEIVKDLSGERIVNIPQADTCSTAIDETCDEIPGEQSESKEKRY